MNIPPNLTEQQQVKFKQQFDFWLNVMGTTEEKAEQYALLDLQQDALLEVKGKVVDRLNALCIPASLEYPGFISVGAKVFGTANETWGWNTDDGTEGGEFEIPYDSTDAEKIADAIIEFLS